MISSLILEILKFKDHKERGQIKQVWPYKNPKNENRGRVFNTDAAPDTSNNLDGRRTDSHGRPCGRRELWPHGRPCDLFICPIAIFSVVIGAG